MKILLVALIAVAGLSYAVRYSTEKPIGSFCLRGADCRSGRCLIRGTLPSGVCTQTCKSDSRCEGGTTCRFAGDARVCMKPPSVDFGGRCDGPEDCLSGLCVRVTSQPSGRIFVRSYCTESCETLSCPSGSTCARSEPAVCLPEAIVTRDEQRFVQASRDLAGTRTSTLAERLDALRRALGVKSPRSYQLVGPTEYAR